MPPRARRVALDRRRAILVEGPPLTAPPARTFLRREFQDDVDPGRSRSTSLMRGSRDGPLNKENIMKFMLIMRATDEAVEAYKEMPFEQVIEAMGKYNESMMKAGVLVAGEGLTDAAEGFVVDFSAEKPLITDGPLRRDQGAVQRFLDPRGLLPRRGCGVGQPRASRTRVVPRGAQGDRSRGLPRRQRVDREGSRLARGAGSARPAVRR